MNIQAFYVKLFLFITFVGILFSMPPYWNFGIFKIYFPSFFMYKILPMFRAYARFGILVMLSISVLAGIGFMRLVSTKKNKIHYCRICLKLKNYSMP